MAEFKFIRSGEKAARGLACWTFLVDGVPSLRWYREATDEEQARGLSPSYFAERAVSRLKAGRSAEAFGPAPQVSVDGKDVPLAAASPDQEARLRDFLLSSGVPAARVEAVLKAARASSGTGRARIVRSEPDAEPREVLLGSGKTKTRAPRPGFRAEVDGRCLGVVFPSEQEAKAAAAIRAFMTAGKLGRLAEAQAALEAQYPGRDCRVFACPDRHRIVATVDGGELAIVFGADGITFKSLPENPTP